MGFREPAARRCWQPSGSLTTNTYSADGKRQSTATGAKTTGFVWDNQNVLQELGAALATLAQYTDWAGYWGGLASQWRGGRSLFYGFDLSSNTRELTDANVTIRAVELYDAFGVPMLSTTVRVAGIGPPDQVLGMAPGFGVRGAVPVANPFGFSGEAGVYTDPDGTVKARRRTYVPWLGRWSSRDPIGFRGRDWNLYRYVKNRPTFSVDPSGKWPWSHKPKPKPKAPNWEEIKDALLDCLKEMKMLNPSPEDLKDHVKELAKCMAIKLGCQVVSDWCSGKRIA